MFFDLTYIDWKQESDPYEKVCSAAMNGDSTLLDQAINQLCIYLRFNGNINSFVFVRRMILACVKSEKLDAPILFLKRFKEENLEFFNVDQLLNFIVQCYSEKGYHEYVRNFLWNSKTHMTLALWKAMGCGIGQSGDIKRIKWFLNFIKEDTSATYPDLSDRSRDCALRSVITGMIEEKYIKTFYLILNEIKSSFTENYDALFIHVLNKMDKAQQKISKSFVVEKMLEKSVNYSALQVYYDKGALLEHGVSPPRELEAAALMRNGFDLDQLQAQADETRALMAEHSLTFNQVTAWYQPEVKVMLLLKPFFNLPVELSAHIISFLFIRVQVSVDDMCVLTNMKLNQTGFFKLKKIEEERKVETPTMIFEKLGKRKR